MARRRVGPAHAVAPQGTGPPHNRAMTQAERAQGLARQSHIVPKFFLRRFRGADGQILVFDKQAATEIRRSPKSLTRRDFYMLTTPDGRESDVVERLLSSKVESPAPEALRRIDAGHFPPTPQDRERLAYFMGMQLVRGPEFRAMVDRLAEEQRAGKVAPLHPELGAKLLEAVSEAAAEEALRRARSQEFQIVSMIEMAPKVAAVLFRLHWILLSGDGFLTADMPIAMWDRATRRAGTDIGVATADEILMPISPSETLLLVPPTTDVVKIERFRLPDPGVAQARTLLWHVAARYTYRHPDTPPAPD